MIYSGYFAHDISDSDIRPQAFIGTWPILPNKAHAMETQKHCMKIHMKATEFVNLGQTPVMAMHTT